MTTSTPPDARPATAAAAASTPSAAVLQAAGPLLLLASELVAPRRPGDLDAAGEAAFTLAHAGRLSLSSVLAVVAAALLAAAFVRLPRLLPGRGVGLARAAAATGALGSVGLAAYHGAALLAVDLVQADPGTAAALDVAFTDGLVGLATLLPVIVLVPVAVLLAGGAARRARRAGWWVVAVAVVAVVVDYSGLGLATAGFAVLAGVVLAVPARRPAGAA